MERENHLVAAGNIEPKLATGLITNHLVGHHAPAQPLPPGKLALRVLRPDDLGSIARAEIRSLDQRTAWGDDGRQLEWDHQPRPADPLLWVMSPGVKRQGGR